MFWAGISQMEHTHTHTDDSPGAVSGLSELQALPALLGCRCGSFPWESPSVNQLHQLGLMREPSHISPLQTHITHLTDQWRRRSTSLMAFLRIQLNLKHRLCCLLLLQKTGSKSLLLWLFKSSKHIQNVCSPPFIVLFPNYRQEESHKSKKKNHKLKIQKENTEDHKIIHIKSQKNNTILITVGITEFRGREKRENSSQNKFN